jgi:TolB-like protein
MERDETGTFSELKASREELFEPEIAKHRGRIFKLMGDGLLVEFASAVDAVECAVALQRSLAERNSTKPKANRFSIRIGINLGEVIVEGEDRHGEGVNVAARLQQLAAPGAVYLSGKVATEIASKLTDGFAQFEDLGLQKLKNMAQMIRVYRLQIGDSLSPVQPPSLNKPTILVLPFINQSGDAEQAYFSDGITEDIILELGKFHELAVIARTSSFAYKGKHKQAQEIGAELGTRYVVEGSVRKIGDAVRIAVQLWETATGAQLWAERYERNLHEIFAVQDDLTQKVVSTVMGRVVQAAYKQGLSLTENELAAYDCWLRGQYAMRRWSPEADQEGHLWFQRALSKDPHFARAHASIAISLNAKTLVTPGYKDEARDRRRAAFHALQAVEHDPGDARCHHSLVWIYLFDKDKARATRHLDLALDLNPNAADTLMSCALGIACLGDLPRAKNIAARAIELNPLHADWYYYFLSQIYFFAGEYERAFELGHPYIENFTELGGWTAAALALIGRETEAVEEGRQFLRVIEDRWAGKRPMRREDAVEWLVTFNNFIPAKFRTQLIKGLSIAGLMSDSS